MRCLASCVQAALAEMPRAIPASRFTIQTLMNCPTIYRGSNVFRETAQEFLGKVRNCNCQSLAGTAAVYGSE
jgi:hypothetical protein